MTRDKGICEAVFDVAHECREQHERNVPYWVYLSSSFCLNCYSLVRRRIDEVTEILVDIRAPAFEVLADDDDKFMLSHHSEVGAW